MADVVPFPFATVEDLKARWPDFPIGGDAHAEVLLEDASQFILDTVPQAATASANTRRRIVCAVVRRLMQSNEAGAVGVESTQLTAGSFSVSSRSTNPHGDFYLTKQEKKALGFGRQAVYGVQIAGNGGLRHRPWCDLVFGSTCSCGAVLTGDGPLWEA